VDEPTAKLLIKAIRTLPQREQDRLLAALLRQPLGESAMFTRPAPPDVVFSYPTSVPLPAPMMGAPGQSTMLPVRLPPELHERLRAWSTEQGFSMASVVRGLVERFLDQQEGATLPKRRPAKRRPKGATARG
jgi:hypothetical protein